MPRSHISPKKLEMERRKGDKQRKRLLRQGRICPGKSVEQKEMEKFVKQQQVAEQAVELARIGNGWFPEMKSADLRILARGDIVKKGDLEFRPMTKVRMPNRVSFVVARHGPNFEKTMLGSFSVDFELKIIKRF